MFDVRLVRRIWRIILLRGRQGEHEATQVYSLYAHPGSSDDDVQVENTIDRTAGGGGGDRKDRCTRAKKQHVTGEGENRAHPVVLGSRQRTTGRSTAISTESGIRRLAQ